MADAARTYSGTSEGRRAEMRLEGSQALASGNTRTGHALYARSWFEGADEWIAQNPGHPLTPLFADMVMGLIDLAKAVGSSNRDNDLRMT